jgi:hypothetical protein
MMKSGESNGGSFTSFSPADSHQTSEINKTTFILLAVAVVLFLIIKKMMEMSA